MKKLLVILFIFVSSIGFAQHQFTTYVTASGTDTYAVTISVPTIANYSTKRIYLRFANANTGASTLNVTPSGGSALGAIAIRAWDGDSWEPLVGGEIVTSQDYVLVYNGTYFELYPSVGGGGSGDIEIGTTAITGGTNTRVLYNNSGLVGEYTVSGSGNVAMTTSPVFTTPNLGTPSALVGTNITGTASGLTAGTVTTNANLTGHVTSTGNAAVLGSFSSSNLSTALTDEIGTGLVIFSERPVRTVTGTTDTPVLADRGGQIVFTNAGSITFTLPTNASVAYPTGSEIWLKGIQSGVVTVVAPSGGSVTSTASNLLSPSPAGTDFSMVVKKTGTDTWTLDNGTTQASALTANNGYFTTAVGGTPGAALLQPASVGVKFTGIAGSVGTGDLVQATGTDTWTALASVSAGSYLRSGGVSTASVWSTLKLPNSATANRIAYATSSNTIGESANLTYDGTLFTVNGGTAFAYAAKTTTYTLTSGDRFIECTSGTFTVTLPTAVGRTGIVYTIDNSGAGTITLATTSSQTIDGASPGTLTAGQKITIYSNGANWRTF